MPLNSSQRKAIYDQACSTFAMGAPLTDSDAKTIMNRYSECTKWLAELKWDIKKKEPDTTAYDKSPAKEVISDAIKAVIAGDGDEESTRRLYLKAILYHATNSKPKVNLDIKGAVRLYGLWEKDGDFGPEHMWIVKDDVLYDTFIDTKILAYHKDKGGKNKRLNWPGCEGDEPDPDFVVGISLPDGLLGNQAAVIADAGCRDEDEWFETP